MDIRAEYQARCRQQHDMANQMPVLYAWTLRYPAPRVIELGVRDGNSTVTFLAAIDRAGAGHLWSADLDYPPLRDQWAGQPWNLIVDDDLSPACAQAMPAECDVLFIDTSHSYGQTRAELDLYGPRVRPGGVILLHDTISYSGVADALTDWCRDTGREWTPTPAWPGLGVVEM